jgi:hypothetical protein
MNKPPEPSTSPVIAANKTAAVIPTTEEVNYCLCGEPYFKPIFCS